MDLTPSNKNLFLDILYDNNIKTLDFLINSLKNQLKNWKYGEYYSMIIRVSNILQDIRYYCTIRDLKKIRKLCGIEYKDDQNNNKKLRDLINECFIINPRFNNEKYRKIFEFYKKKRISSFLKFENNLNDIIILELF